MTLAADHSFDMPPIKGITYVLNGSRFLARFACKMGAATLALVAVFVWLAPGASWESDVMLFKMALSIMAAFCSFALWQNSQPVKAPSVEVDMAQLELRLIREYDGAPRHIIERCAFADLHSVELRGRHITFWAKGERLLAQISLSNANAHATLVTSLRAMGKLA